MNAVIIVAGGKGRRFGGDIPKQYLLLDDSPIYIHTIRQFIQFDSSIEIILVIPETTTLPDLVTLEKEIEKFKLGQIIICKGGQTRFHSVKNGIASLSENSQVVGVHDAVRPFVSQEVIDVCYTTAREFGNAVPAIPLTNSIRKIQSEVSVALNRNEYRLIQTPQCFTKDQLTNAYRADYQDYFTDDASVVEACGYKIKLVKGNLENIKITTPPDLFLAKYYLNKND